MPEDDASVDTALELSPKAKFLAAKEAQEEEKRSLEKPEYKEARNVVIIGEHHGASLSDHDNAEEVREIIGAADIVVLEASPSDRVWDTEEHKGVMREAFDIAKMQDMELHILSDETGESNLPLLYSLIQKADIPLEPQEFVYINAVHVLDLYQRGIDGGAVGDMGVVVESLRNFSASFLNSEDEAGPIIDEALGEYRRAGRDKNFARPRDEISRLALKIQSVAREVAYQEIVKKISEENPEKKIVAVVGKDHMDPIHASLDRGYTSANQRGLLPSLREARAELKKLP